MTSFTRRNDNQTITWIQPDSSTFPVVFLTSRRCSCWRGLTQGTSCHSNSAYLLLIEIEGAYRDNRCIALQSLDFPSAVAEDDRCRCLAVERAGKKVTLTIVAAERSEMRRMACGLDPLGNHFHLQGSCEQDNRSHDLGVFFRNVEVADE